MIEAVNTADDGSRALTRATSEPEQLISEHPNATAYRRAAAAFRARDLATVEALVDAEVVWHVPGNHPQAGDLRGRDALMDFLTRVGELGFWLREHDVFGNDAHVSALSEMGATRPGVSVCTRVVSIFHFRDGRQVERWFYPEDQHAWNAIFGGLEKSSTLTPRATREF